MRATGRNVSGQAHSAAGNLHEARHVSRRSLSCGVILVDSFPNDDSYGATQLKEKHYGSQQWQDLA